MIISKTKIPVKRKTMKSRRPPWQVLTARLPLPVFWKIAIKAVARPTPKEPANCWTMLKTELTSADCLRVTRVVALEIVLEKVKLKPARIRM